MRRLLLIILFFVAFTLIAPFALTDYGVLLTTEIAVMAIFAMSLGLIMGYAGLVSLGHAAYFGIGAYTIAFLGQYVSNTYLLILTAIIASGIIALITGALFVKTSRLYFLMITLAFGQSIYAIFHQSSWFGASDGMTVIAPLDFGFGEIVDPTALYYTMTITFIVIYILIRNFIDSPAGKITKGVMENESRMKALGYNIQTYKLITYTISGSVAGLAGALYAYMNFFVSPELSYWMFSGEALVMVIIGGIGTLMGPVIGAGIYIILQNLISGYTEYWSLILGTILIALVLLGRGGVINLLIYLKDNVLNKKQPKYKSSKTEETKQHN